MPIDTAKIAQMERELAEAKRQLLEEDGKRYQITRREISEEEWERILNNLADRQERILFGLEAPESEGRQGRHGRPRAAGVWSAPSATREA